MNFEEIENLTDEQINELYGDIVEFGEEKEGGCCCARDVRINGYYYYRASCSGWCRIQGSSCSGWNNYDSAGSFFCNFGC